MTHWKTFEQQVHETRQLLKAAESDLLDMRNSNYELQESQKAAERERDDAL